MLSQVNAIRFAQRITSGRNSPLLLGCEKPDGTEIEVVVKTTTKECPVSGLIREAWSAMLAADLELPVPEPFIVEIGFDFASSVSDDTGYLKSRLTSCERLAFGSTYVAPGYTVWNLGSSIPAELQGAAAEVYCFDALVLNPDRRPQNPNCLTNGDSLLIFDHELALNVEGVGGYLNPYPWRTGALTTMTEGPGEHLFAKGLKKKNPNVNRLEVKWADIDGSRFEEYRRALPTRWATVDGFSDSIKSYLELLHQNLPAAFDEVRRSLR